MAEEWERIPCKLSWLCTGEKGTCILFSRMGLKCLCMADLPSKVTP